MRFKDVRTIALEECNLNEYVLKSIVGHSINDVTEKVYTHRTIEKLKEEMEKITYFFQ